MFEKWFQSSGFGPTERPYLEACWRDSHAIACAQAVLVLNRRKKVLLTAAQSIEATPGATPEERAAAMDARTRAKALAEAAVEVAEMPIS
jgi:hypothetical protein